MAASSGLPGFEARHDAVYVARGGMFGASEMERACPAFNEAEIFPKKNRFSAGGRATLAITIAKNV